MTMHAKTQSRPVGFVVLVLVSALAMFGVMPAAAAEQGIGFTIASNGMVTIASKTAGARPASLRQDVFPGDVIKTGPNSTTKVLFDDNTILNVTEGSEIAINEYVSDPAAKQRRTVFNMLSGQVKAVVPGFYAATNSRFEIRTPTAVAAAAHETEYVVWTFVQNGQASTGIAVVTGSVTVTSHTGETVTVSAGEFTTVSSPPTPPARWAGTQVQPRITKSDVPTDPSVLALVKEAMAKREGAQAAIAGGDLLPPPGLVTVLPIVKCTGVVSGSGNVPAGCTP